MKNEQTKLNKTNQKQPTVCLLKNCITDKDLIKKYLSEHPWLSHKEEADYVLVASETHLLYKYETPDGVWYIHYGVVDIFKICVYAKELK